MLPREGSSGVVFSRISHPGQCNDLSHHGRLSSVGFVVGVTLGCSVGGRLVHAFFMAVWSTRGETVPRQSGWERGGLWFRAEPLL